MANLIKEVRLIKADNGIDPKTGKQINSYKFWIGKLYDDESWTAEWARVGAIHPESGQWHGAKKFDAKVREKLSAKKGYTEQKTIGSVTNGGMAPSSVIKSQDLHTIARTQLIKASNPTLERLITRLVQANVHTITTSTQITYNASTGGFATPLGQVTMEGLIEARDLLANMAPLIRARKFGTQADQILCKYLRIIPQDIGRKGFSTETLIPDDNSLQKQLDLIDSLESSLQAATPAPTPTQPNKPMEQVFKVDLEVLTDAAERARLDRFYEKSKKSMHHYDNVHVREIYKVAIHDINNQFLSTDPNITEVFHGSSMANCLSILKGGLKINPPSTAAIAGKLFGNGLYGAVNSTKSLGYCLNRWGQGGVGDAAFLFICSFAMGNPYSTTEYGCSRPYKYDSVWAKASAGGLRNDELIVYSENRSKVNYLLECK